MEVWIWLVIAVAILVLLLVAFVALRAKQRKGSVLAAPGSGTSNNGTPE